MPGTQYDGRDAMIGSLRRLAYDQHGELYRDRFRAQMLAGTELVGRITATEQERGALAGRIAAAERELSELETWARFELITDDGFAQSCVLESVRQMHAALGVTGGES